jgi:uncharacterized protein YggE
MEPQRCCNSQRTFANTLPLGGPHRTIEVQAEGEVKCVPDTFTFNITITNTKLKLSEAQSSVKRRSNYIMQVLRNHGHKDRHIDVMEEIRRNQDELHSVRCTISARGDNIGKTLQARNVIIEKMDSTVECSNVHCDHSISHKANKREESFKLAVIQAKCKAREVSQCLGVHLGSLVKLVEESSEEKSHWRDEEKCCHDNVMTIDTLERQSLTYTSTITATFEVLVQKNIKRK